MAKEGDYDWHLCIHGEDYLFPQFDAEDEKIFYVAKKKSTEVILNSLAKTVESLRKAAYYEFSLRRNYVTLHLILNVQKTIAPAFRPLLHTRAGQGGYDDADTALLNDHQVIDLHWLVETGLIILQDDLPYRWQDLICENGALDLKAASRLAGTGGSIGTKTGKILRMGSTEQAQCIVLCGSDAKRRRNSARKKLAMGRTVIRDHARRHPASQIDPVRWDFMLHAFALKAGLGGEVTYWYQLLTGETIDRRRVHQKGEQFRRLGVLP